MRILFVRERWADGKPELGESDGSYMIPTLERTGMGEAVIFHYDESLQQGFTPDVDLTLHVARFQPDIIIFSHLLSLGNKNIKKDTWDAMRARGIKVVGAWHEGIAPDVVRVADEHAEDVDLNLFLDTKDQFLNCTKHPDKCLGLFDPRDAEAFKPDEIRTVDVYFTGTLLGRVQRCAGIFTLLANGIPVTKTGGRRELFMSEEWMRSTLGKTKIGLNFSDAGPYRHYKGRVAEVTLSGAMLMELDNPETESIFAPYKEYVPFDGPEDLLKKAIYYLEHDDERMAIAEAGRQKALEKLDGREFWKGLFQRLGVGSAEGNE